MATAGSSTLMNLEDSSSEEGAVEVTTGTQEVVDINSDSDAPNGEMHVDRNADANEAEVKSEAPAGEDGGDEKEEGEASDGEIPEEEDGNTGTDDAPPQVHPPNGGGGGNATVIAISSDDEDGEVDGKAAQRALISEAMASGARDVKEKDLRFFQADDVICQHCGLRGHLSYDCEEEVARERCNMCGGDDHKSYECPNDMCWRCGQRGHMAKFCRLPRETSNNNNNSSALRSVSPARNNIMPMCYVCGSMEHADCSLMYMPCGVKSCYNCGLENHTGAECQEPRADRWTAVVGDLERERRQSGHTRKKQKFKKGMTEEQKEAQKDRELEEDKIAFRAELIERIRNNSRTGRRDRDGGGRGGRGNNFHRGGRGNDQHARTRNHNTNRHN